MKKILILFSVISVFSLLLPGCSVVPSEQKTTETKSIILYNWDDYLPESLLKKFESETGIHVDTIFYDQGEKALSAIEDGTVTFDLAILDDESIPQLITDHKLKTIDINKISNFKNISVNFRDLFIDPGNSYSIPYCWGTTGILVREDLLAAPITSWRDLWRADIRNRLILRKQPNELIGVALKAAGYSIYNPTAEQLQTAYNSLLAIKKTTKWLDAEDLYPFLDSGEYVAVVGWNGDAILAEEEAHTPIKYIIPEEGAIIWGDSYVISAQSQKQAAVEKFINFMLQPENSAAVTNTYGYATANEAAKQYIRSDFLKNKILFPDNSVFKKADWFYSIDGDFKKKNISFIQQMLAEQ